MTKRFVTVYAWDDGNGFDKQFSEIGPDNTVHRLFKELCFPSLVVEIGKSIINKPLVVLSNSSTTTYSPEEQLLNEMEIEYQGKKYAVGKHALSIDPNLADRNYLPTKFRNVSRTVKLLAGMSYLFLEYDEIEIYELAVGLSLEAYYAVDENDQPCNYGDEIETMYTKKTFQFKAKNLSGQMRPVTVKIHRCKCTEQGITALYDLFFDYLPNGHIVGQKEHYNFMQKRYGFVDIGNHTNDAGICNGISPVPGKEVINKFGLSKAYSSVSQKLDYCPDSTIEDYYLTQINPDIPDYLKRKPLYWNKKEFGRELVIQLCEEALDQLGDEIINKMNLNWKNDIGFLEFILLCGGGAIVFKEKFEKAFNTRIIISKKPQFANALGNYKVRRFKYNRMPEYEIQSVLRVACL